MSNFDAMKLSVETLSGGRNTVVLDDRGIPSIMVRIPRFNLSEVIDGAPNTPHPAFIVNGVVKDEILVSKFQNMVMNDRAYSLPFKDPRTSVNFDQAVAFCKNKGAGWHLTTNAEWAAIALWTKKNGTMPRGNTDYGRDHVATHERGVESHKSDATRTGRIHTGSGPVTWAHDHTNAGIFDMTGNVWEWTGGMRTNNGEIQVIENNDAADNTKDQSTGSGLWKAILAADGSLVAPGTAGTLKYDGTSPVKLSTEVAATASVNSMFQDMTVEAGITLPVIAKALGLAPDGTDYEGRSRFYVNTDGERLPFRGGNWNIASSAGVFAANLNISRSNSSTNFGFRAAFVL